jgi:flagellar assembly protein FliH
MLSSTTTTTRDANGGAQAYVYPTPAAPGSGGKPAAVGGTPSTLESLFTPEGKPAGPPPVNEEQIRAREARARSDGREEGHAQARAEFDKKLAAERQAMGQAIRDFARERETYFQRVEAEVVALALAITRKILHREAQVDPLLLAGVVRVGLDKVATSTQVRLKVHPAQIQAWRDYFSQQSGLPILPELVGDGSLGPGRCILETELGSTDLTLESQLKEIEQGFFDLLAQNPKKP